MSVDFIDENNSKEFDYVTYGRQFISYRWFKPFLVIVLFLIFYIILGAVLIATTGVYDFIRTDGNLNGYLDLLKDSASYESLRVNDVTSCLVNLGGIAVMIPALAIASGIVRDRSFASYGSSRGGWSHIVFLKSFVLAVVICGGILFLQNFVFNSPGAFNNSFTKSGLIALCILCPLQCMAEEYIFRGLLTQTLGSWTRLPIMSIIISAIAFAALHPYNNAGRIAILATGLGMGFAAWIGHGIEVSSAMHIVNNMAAFLMDGFGYSEVTSEVTTGDVIWDVTMIVAYLAVIYIISIKTDWFDRLKYNDAGDWNELLTDKRNRKAAKKAAKAF